VSTASTSVSKTESPGSNPCAPAIIVVEVMCIEKHVGQRF
jgi:hypothetical protein